MSAALAETKPGPIWARLPKEPAHAYGSFVIYRDMSPSARSLTKLAKLVPHNLSMLKVWSSKWNWVERAAQYTAHLDELSRGIREDAIAAERRRATEAALAIGRNLQTIGNARLVGGKVGDVSVNALNPNLLEADDTIRFLVEGDKMVRLALGLPTDLRGNIHISLNDFRRIVGGFVTIAEKHMTPEAHTALVLECEGMLRELLGAPT